MAENIPSTTTSEEDLVTKGQRTVNLIWESTQGLIAVSITFAIIFCAFNEITSPELTNAFFLIIGFYFSRTNHSSVGGVGKKINQNYEGR